MKQPILLTVAEYAAKHGTTVRAIRARIIRGHLKPVKKIGRNHMIAANEPFPVDRRYKKSKAG